MAIVTIDQALAGMQPGFDFTKAATPALVAGRPQDLSSLAGSLGAWAIPAEGLGGSPLTSWQGQIPFANPVSGNSYIGSLALQSNQLGTLLLCDRLWENSGIDPTSTSEQVFTGSAQIPARDANGSNAGFGVQAAAVVYVATGAGTPTMTLKYTNQAGTAGQTSTNLDATVASSAIGAFYRFSVAAGDTGIQKAQSITLNTTWTQGSLSVVLYRVLARRAITQAGVAAVDDIFTLGRPQLYNNSVPFLVFIPSSTSAAQVGCFLAITQG